MCYFGNVSLSYGSVLGASFCCVLSQICDGVSRFRDLSQFIDLKYVDLSCFSAIFWLVFEDIITFHDINRLKLTQSND